MVSEVGVSEVVVSEVVSSEVTIARHLSRMQVACEWASGLVVAGE